jgi:hypothetical protein
VRTSVFVSYAIGVLSPDASGSIAAAEVAEDESEGLIGLHAEMVASDLGDPEVVRDLLIRVEGQRKKSFPVGRDRCSLRERLARLIRTGPASAETTTDVSSEVSSLPMGSRLGRRPEGHYREDASLVAATNRSRNAWLS